MKILLLVALICLAPLVCSAQDQPNFFSDLKAQLQTLGKNDPDFEKNYIIKSHPVAKLSSLSPHSPQGELMCVLVYHTTANYFTLVARRTVKTETQIRVPGYTKTVSTITSSERHTIFQILPYTLKNNKVVNMPIYFSQFSARGKDPATLQFKVANPIPECARAFSELDPAILKQWNKYQARLEK